MSEYRQIDLNNAGVTKTYAQIDSGGAYTTIFTSITDVIQLVFDNGTNQPVQLSIDGGTTDWITLQSGRQFAWDIGANGGLYSGTVKAKYPGSAATSGNFVAAYVKLKDEA